MDINRRLIDTYLEMISRLGFDSKLELISRLSSSMKKQPESSKESVLRLFGAFSSEESAEEIIEKIRSSRVFNRNLERFD